MQLPNGNDEEMKNLQRKNKKWKKEIEKGEFKGFIMGRSKSQKEIETRIGRLADEFQKKRKKKRKKKKKESYERIHLVTKRWGSKFRGIGRNVAG